MRAPPIIIRDERARARVLRLLMSLDLTKPWKVTVERTTKRRSLRQNSLLWMWHSEVVKAVGEHTGMDAEDIHEFFKHKFLTPRMIEINGESVPRYTTTKLTTAEMSAYMDRIYAFCTSEIGLLLPLPDEYLRDAA